MYITCPNCKQQIEDTEAKCPYCNTAISEENRCEVIERHISNYKDMPEEIKLMYEFSKRGKIKLYLTVAYVVSIFLIVPLIMILFGFNVAVGLFVGLSIVFLIIASETKCFRCPFCDRLLPVRRHPYKLKPGPDLISTAYDAVKSGASDDQCPYCNARSL
jgi:predicted amidophosphoribosyltransferase